MANEPFYAPNRQPPRQRKPGELLFTFGRGIDVYACELRDHGEFGIEAQILINGTLLMARMFRDDLERGPRGRSLAIAWLEQARTTMETGA
jgi:hypothetical protein